MHNSLFKKLEQEVPAFLFDSAEKLFGVKLPTSYKLFLSQFQTDEESLSIEFPLDNGSTGIIYPVYPKKAMVVSIFNVVELVYHWIWNREYQDHVNDLQLVEIGDGGWSGDGGLYMGIGKNNYEYIYYANWWNDFGNRDISLEDLNEHFLVCKGWDSFIEKIVMRDDDDDYNRYKTKMLDSCS